MASAATVIVLNGFKVEVLASSSTDVLISETKTMGGISYTSTTTYPKAPAAAAGRDAAMAALAYANGSNTVPWPKGNMQPFFEMTPDPGPSSGVTTDPAPNGGLTYTYQIPSGTCKFTHYK